MSISFVDDISSLQVEVTKPFDINLVHIELHAGIIILVPRNELMHFTEISSNLYLKFSYDYAKLFIFEYDLSV